MDEFIAVTTTGVLVVVVGWWWMNGFICLLVLSNNNYNNNNEWGSEMREIWTDMGRKRMKRSRRRQKQP